MPDSSRSTRRRIVNQVTAMTRMSATMRGTRDTIVTARVLEEHRAVRLGKLTSTSIASVNAAAKCTEYSYVLA